VNRDEAIELIIRAAQWLMSNPDVYSGQELGGTYTVYIAAKSTDFVAGCQGVYFGHSEQFLSNGNFNWSSSLMLIDIADRQSYHDDIPLTITGDPHLGMSGQWYVDLYQLQAFSDEKLLRMATNGIKILRSYGQI